MISRPTQRTAPKRYPYIVIDTERGPHQMRIPSMLAVTKLVKSLDRAHLAVLMGVTGHKTTAGVLTILKESGPEVAAGLAALIGLAWHHAELDLEAARGSDLLAYGEAVYEEMHGAGYTLSDVASLALVLVRAIWEHSQLSAEVQARAGFIFPMLGAGNSNGSTSGSPTSETRSDSIS